MLMFQPVGGMDRIPYALAKAVRRHGRPDHLRRAGHARSPTRPSGVRVVYTGRVARRASADGRLLRVARSRRRCSRGSRATSRQATKDALAYARPGAHRQDRPRVPPPLVGGGRAHLRRHHQHQHGPVDDLVPVVRLPRRPRASSSATTTSAPTRTYGDLAAGRAAGARRRPGREDPRRHVPRPSWRPRSRSPGRRSATARAAGSAGPPARAASTDGCCEPDGNVYFAGDHLSYYIAWQAGAFESARKVVMRPPRPGA